ncbi:TIGR01906 family membrane protein [Streptococcus dentasini]
MKDKLYAGLSAIWFLSAAVLATIYLAWAVYPLENHWLRLAPTVDLSTQALLKNFNQLMAYLTLPWIGQLKMADFPSSEDGLAHFRDVKHLFHLAQAVFILGFWPALHFLRRHWQSQSLWLFGRLWLALIALLPIIGILGYLIGFEAFFTLFHQLLFPGANNWLFNPYTDPVIWVLPEEYFLHCFIIFFVIYEALMISLWLLARTSYQHYISKEKVFK